MSGSGDKSQQPQGARRDVSQGCCWKEILRRGSDGITGWGAGLRSHCQPHCPPLASSPTWPGHGYWAEGAQRGWDCPLHHCRGGPEHGEQRWTEGSRVYRPGCQSSPLTREDLAGQGGSHEQGGSYSAGATLTDFHVPPHDQDRKVLFCSPSS